MRRRVREAAEAEEREFYAHRAPPDWLEALAPLGTDADKRFIETAPWLVVGYPAPDARVPDIRRKPPEEVATFIE